MSNQLICNDSEYLQSNSTKYLDIENEEMQHNASSTEIDEIQNETRSHLPILYQFIVTFFYIFGIVGNVAALRIISRSETKRFKKQALMLKCLALNDLLALLGSFIVMYAKRYFPSADAKVLCAIRVVCRAFGLGSGCVSTVMALDRWLALSHPFTYQRHITQTFVRSFIYGLWIFNVLLVCAPFLGFGLWFDETRLQKPCMRYRCGKTILDRTYAHVVFVFGMCLCTCIVCCNLSVIRVLCDMGKRLISRRYSGSSCRSSSSRNEPLYNNATPEELSFAKLMAVLSIFFVICWVPQLVTIIATQHSLLQSTSQIYKGADVLIALNFTLDPFIYVLFRRKQKRRSKSDLRGLTAKKYDFRKETLTPKTVTTNDSIPSINGNASSEGSFVNRDLNQPLKQENEYLPLQPL